MSDDRPAGGMVKDLASSDAGRLPEPRLIAPGLHVIAVGIPNNPLRYVLVYVLEVADGVVLVDAGWGTPDALDDLTAGLDAVGASIIDVRGVLVTHLHPDHYGLAGRIHELSDAWIAMHPADAQLIDERYGRVEGLLDRTLEWFAVAGVPQDVVNQIHGASLSVQATLTVVHPHVLLEDGDRPDIPGWELVALHTPGHTPGHLCFLDQGGGRLFTGDHVLPRITPNVAFHPQSGDDPLGAFLRSLERVAELGPLHALPGHNEPFDDVACRAQQIIAHHEERLDQALHAVEAGAQTVWEVTSTLRWSRPFEQIPPYMRRAAMGETHAHLILLERRGRVSSTPGRPVRWRMRLT